jgi:hypothetical protein
MTPDSKKTQFLSDIKMWECVHLSDYLFIYLLRLKARNAPTNFLHLRENINSKNKRLTGCVTV